MIRRSFLQLIPLAALTACHPIPGPDGGSGGVTPGGVLAVVESVFDVLNVILPILRPFFTRFIPDGTAKQAVLTTAEVVVRAGTDWKIAAAVYRERGGDACQIYALTGTLTSALVHLSSDLVQAGFGWGNEIATLLDSLGILLDRLVGRCGLDAGLDAGALAIGGHAGDAIEMQLASFRDAATAPLRQLPPLSPSSLR